MIDAFGAAMMIAVVYGTAMLCVRQIRKGKSNAARFYIGNLTALYFLLLFCVTLLPVKGGYGKNANFLPFVHMLLKTSGGYTFHGRVFLHYWTTSLLNVLLFLPFGFFLTFLLEAARPKKSFLLVGMLAVFTSLLIEAAQLALPVNRVFDVDDLIFNTLGGVFGISAYHWLTQFRAFRNFIALFSQKGPAGVAAGSNKGGPK